MVSRFVTPRPLRALGIAIVVAATALLVSVVPAGAVGNVTLSPTHGPPLTTITVTGNCQIYFPTTNVGITFTGIGGTATVSTHPGNFGLFQATVQVPASTQPGPATVQAGCESDPGGAVSVPFHVDGPAPSATITTPSGLLPPGAGIEGAAADVGGPGVQYVVLYYGSLLSGGTSGALLAACGTCGPGAQNVAWTVAHGAVPPGIYVFVAEAIDTALDFGTASNAAYLIVE